MRDRLIIALFTSIYLAAAAAGIVAFATVTPSRDITRSLPDMDGAETRAAAIDEVTIGENFQRFPIFWDQAIYFVVFLLWRC